MQAVFKPIAIILVGAAILGALGFALAIPLGLVL
tara:strand:+ start:5011 stop:5112 length:102 start_codon:yes stop_codon:yes gene_type:complete